jgi:hypothetical protein
MENQIQLIFNMCRDMAYMNFKLDQLDEKISLMVHKQASQVPTGSNQYHSSMQETSMDSPIRLSFGNQFPP